MPENDTRAGRFPRFEEENFRKNLKLADKVKEIADEKGATPGQLALAWLLQGGDDIAPIPGTKSRERLEENAAADVTLTDEDLRHRGGYTPRLGRWPPLLRGTDARCKPLKEPTCLKDTEHSSTRERQSPGVLSLQKLKNFKKN